MERNPLFEITKTVFLQIVLMKLINLSTYPRFFISRNSLSTLPKAFSWSIDTTNVLLFLEVQFTVSSRIVYKFENIDRFGILDICSLESACSWVIVVMSEDVLHDWIDRSSRPDVLCEKGAACNFIKRETLARVFSCEFCEISKNTYFYRTPLDDCFWWSDNYHQQKSWNNWLFIGIFLKLVIKFFTFESIIFCFQYRFSMRFVLSIFFFS